MRFGLFLPPFADFAEPERVVALARDAESAGWDGLFLWDHMLAFQGMAVADSWITLAAVAQATERIRIGAMVTPLARRRPWVLARQAATLDRLSRGRLVVGAGLGDDGWKEFGSFSGEATDPRARAELLDESLELMRAFWFGEPVEWVGNRFEVETGPFLPRPVQQPLPIWVACRWPHKRPLDRAAKHQGVFPLFDQGGSDIPPLPAPNDVTALRGDLLRRGAPETIDIVCRGVSGLVEEAERQEALAELEAAGMTWWLESFGP
ncbi:MAG: LLM class flavin-dependent oxidoreductase, partial [Acidimicrobiales bacterium]